MIETLLYFSIPFFLSLIPFFCVVNVTGLDAFIASLADPLAVVVVVVAAYFGAKAIHAWGCMIACWRRGLCAGDHASVIVKKGAPGCGKTLSAIAEGLQIAAAKWTEIQQEYFLLKQHFDKWKTASGAWDQDYLRAHKLRADRIEEIISAYEFYTAHDEYIPCFFCNIEVTNYGRKSYPFTYEYVMQKRRLPFGAVIVIDEVGNSFGVRWSRAVQNRRDPLHEDAVRISRFFRWVRHFGFTAILTEQDDENIFINIRRVVQYNELMETCAQVCLPRAFMWVYDRIMRRAIRGKVKDRRGKPLVRLKRFMSRVGFLRFETRLDGNTENNTIQLQKQRSEFYYISRKLDFGYDTRYFAYKYEAQDSAPEAFDFAVNAVAVGRQEYDEEFAIEDVETLVDLLFASKKGDAADSARKRVELRDKIIERAAIDTLLQSMLRDLVNKKTA